MLLFWMQMTGGKQVSLKEQLNPRRDRTVLCSTGRELMKADGSDTGPGDSGKGEDPLQRTAET